MVTNFTQLYMQNCNGCHGADGNIGGSISLDDQTYLSVVPVEKVREIIANGIPRTLMPPFSQANGGVLTDNQIDILVAGISAWKKGTPSPDLPPYSAPPGNAATGEHTYAAYVAALGKSADASMFKDGFLTNRAFLGLSSDQYLRTLIITGRPELGIPNYQNAIPGQPLTSQQISDMVAWLVSQRKNKFGHPLTPPPVATY
jgi:mono/diheme cytochrome c family protein